MRKFRNIVHRSGLLTVLIIVCNLIILSACSSQNSQPLELQRALGDKLENVVNNKMLPLDPENAALYGYGESNSRSADDKVAVTVQSATDALASASSEAADAKVAKPADKQGDKPAATTLPAAVPQKDIKEAIGKSDDIKWHRDDELQGEAKVQTVAANMNTLRLALLDAAAFHPFNERNEYDQTVNKLLFRSLFRFDKSNKPVNDLVKEYRFSNDHKIVEITLDNSALYADGTPIDAYDVVAALELLSGKNTKSQALRIAKASKYYKQFEAVDRVEQVDAYGLKIYLNKPDLYLVYALTFPVIKDDELLARGLGSFTASGAYRMLDSEAEKRRYNFPVETSDYTYVQRELGDRPSYFNSLIRAFTVKELASEESAVSAFLAHDIDLCYTWPGYNKQLANYEHYVFNSAAALNLTFNQPQGDDVNYFSDMQLLKSRLSGIYNDSFLFREIDPALGPAPWPFVEELLRPYKSIPAYPLNNLIRQRDKLSVAFNKSEWTLVVPAELNFVSDIVSRLRQNFSEFGLKLVVYQVKFDNLPKYLENSEWDLVLAPFIAHRIPDIGYELKELASGAFWREINGQAYLPKFFVNPGELTTAIDILQNFNLNKNMLSPLEDAAYQEAFCKLYTSSNTFSLLKYNRALYLQDNVRGELRPSALDPLSGLEDLWVWSTSS